VHWPNEFEPGDDQAAISRRRAPASLPASATTIGWRAIDDGKFSVRVFTAQWADAGWLGITHAGRVWRLRPSG